MTNFNYNNKSFNFESTSPPKEWEQGIIQPITSE